MNRTDKFVLSILGASSIASSIVSFIFGTLIYEAMLAECSFFGPIIGCSVSVAIIIGGVTLMYMYRDKIEDDERDECENTDVIKMLTPEEKLNNENTHNPEKYESHMYMQIKLDELRNKNILVPVGNYTMMIADHDKFVKEMSELSREEVDSLLYLIQQSINSEEQFSIIKKNIKKATVCDLCIGVTSDLQELYKAFKENNVFTISSHKRNGIRIYNYEYQNDIDEKYFCYKDEVVLYKPIKGITDINFLLVLEYARAKGHIIEDRGRFKFVCDFNRDDVRDMLNFIKHQLQCDEQQASVYMDNLAEFTNKSVDDACDEYSEALVAELRYKYESL